MFVIFVVVIVTDVIAAGVDIVVAVAAGVVVVVVVVVVVIVDVVVVVGITHIIGITSNDFLSLLWVIHTYVLQRGPDNNDDNNKFVLYTNYKGLEQFCVQLCSCGFLGC